MSKISLTNLVNLQNETTAVNAINANNAVLTTALDNTLSRDGTSPNTMGANLDMNSNRILNLPSPVGPNDPVRLTDVNTLNGGGTITVQSLPTGGTTGQSLTKNSNTNFDAGWSTPVVVGVTPTGGTAGQTLVKNTSTNYDYSWATPSTPVLPPQGRLTLTTTVAVTTTDVTGATSIFYTPTTQNQIPIYNGSIFIETTFSELTLALDSNAVHTGFQQLGKAFDLFVFNSSGVKLGSGPAWTSDTTRGTGAGTTELQLLNGIWTNKNSMTTRFGVNSGDTVAVAANQATYVGTFYATANGQASDTLSKRLLWNAYNQVLRPVRVTDPVASYTYGTSTFRQANANAANQLDCIFGLAGGMVSLTAWNVYNGTAADQPLSGIGLDNTTNIAASQFMAVPNTSPQSFIARYEGFPGLGRHTLKWLEGLQTNAAGTGTWYGTSSGTAVFGTGLIGNSLS